VVVGVRRDGVPAVYRESRLPFHVFDWLVSRPVLDSVMAFEVTQRLCLLQFSTVDVKTHS
jgi:hypothetical protein